MMNGDGTFYAIALLMALSIDFFKASRGSNLVVASFLENMIRILLSMVLVMPGRLIDKKAGAKW
jgi:hypothetical protein